MELEQDMALSDNWRINKSTSRTMEMVEVLRSLRRLATQHSNNVDDVTFMEQALITEAGGYQKPTEQNQHRQTIAVTPKLLLDSSTYPLDGHDFDFMAGIVMHETAHIESRSDWVRACCQQSKLHDMIATAGEEIVADKYYKGKKQMRYIDKARAKFAPEPKTTGDSVVDAFDALASIAIYKRPIPQLNAETQEILMVLLNNMSNVTKYQPEKRVAIYQQAAVEIQNIMTNRQMKQQMSQPRSQRRCASGSSGAGQDSNNQGMSSKQARDKAESKARQNINSKLSQASDDLKKNLDPAANKTEAGLNAVDASAVAAALAEEAFDVTGAVDNAVSSAMRSSQGLPSNGDPDMMKAAQQILGTRRKELANRRIYPVISKQEQTDNHRDVDENLVNQLVWLKNLKTQRDTVIKRGLASGKIDSRRLYKAPVDSEIFRNKEMKKNEKRVIWLLMDGSGSMSSDMGNRLYRMCAATAKALPDSRIYTYSHTHYLGENCHLITRTDDRKGMQFISATGGTPSGDALVYVAQMLNAHGGGTLIHFTDGDCNTGITTKEALTTVDRLYKKVNLINVVEHGSHEDYQKVESDHIKTVDIQKASEFAELLKKELAHIWKLGM